MRSGCTKSQGAIAVSKNKQALILQLITPLRVTESDHARLNWICIRMRRQKNDSWGTERQPGVAQWWKNCQQSGGADESTLFGCYIRYTVCILKLMYFVLICLCCKDLSLVLQFVFNIFICLYITKATKSQRGRESTVVQSNTWPSLSSLINGISLA